ncbi:kunitz trypsin inhibitor 5-like [Vicia villosa]|uniref:kunitz trypsin inhibitor 5-like n=1 Tax=Vicia villosa TaxID=3911 RepID=UPI00273BD182|nr:kunitz trypsin inhibitor 5-like [Vicia villosa]
MKITLLAFLLLFAFMSSQPLLGAADASNDQVVDILGKKLRADAHYYILPVLPIHKCGPYDKCRSSGSSLALASIGKTCPLDVVVVDKYQGMPLAFTPVNPKKGVIRVSTDLNIKFAYLPTCLHHPLVWKLDRFDNSKRQWFVTTGGVVGNPGWETINNWFKIDKYGDAYKLVYCPSVVQSSKHMCKDVGVFVNENGSKRLALSDVPLKVKFQQALY